jgi:hypothetical protein
MKIGSAYAFFLTKTQKLMLLVFKYLFLFKRDS